jgi:phospholipid/cholesterol/gamma-HCH transport system permease protein
VQFQPFRHCGEISIKFFDFDVKGRLLYCQGEWTLKTLMSIKRAFQTLEDIHHVECINGKDITRIDSAGAWVLYQWFKQFQSNPTRDHFQGFDPKHLKLIELIIDSNKNPHTLPIFNRPNFLARIGIEAVAKVREFINFLNFLGMITCSGIKLIKKPLPISYRSTLYTLESSGIYAMPLIALLSFLIGMVLAYQMGLQLINYGANIYIVDLLGTSVWREFAPLMTAIIVAGRSGSAFTAQLGTMKIREEVDALVTMGLSPIDILVIPKIWGLSIAVPLLTILAGIFGVAGGMLVSQTMLKISYMDFIHRFYAAVPVKSFWIGMIKTPVFGFVIAAIGCFQGLQVFGSATSVGEKTTKSVVQAIFMIIILDAIFSVLFSELGY